MGLYEVISRVRRGWKGIRKGESEGEGSGRVKVKVKVKVHIKVRGRVVGGQGESKVRGKVSDYLR